MVMTGGEKMSLFPNLKAEMSRRGINGTTVSTHMGVTPKTFSNKMIGKREFTLSEMVKIRTLFNGLSLDYLFETSNPDERVG